MNNEIDVERRKEMVTHSIEGEKKGILPCYWRSHYTSSGNTRETHSQLFCKKRHQEVMEKFNIYTYNYQEIPSIHPEDRRLTIQTVYPLKENQVNIIIEYASNITFYNDKDDALELWKIFEICIYG